jgi:hypothetical protein
VDNPLFRDWALFGRTNLSERDLPHQTKLLEMIFEKYENEHQKMLSDFQVSCFHAMFKYSFMYLSYLRRLSGVFHSLQIVGVTLILRHSLPLWHTILFAGMDTSFSKIGCWHFGSLRASMTEKI